MTIETHPTGVPIFPILVVFFFFNLWPVEGE